MVPKAAQTKPVLNANQGPNGDESNDNAEIDRHESFIDQQINNKEKLKETIELIKSSNKQMSQIAMNIFFKQELEKREDEFVK